MKQKLPLKLVKEKEVEVEDNLARDLIQIKQDAADKEKPQIAPKKTKKEEASSPKYRRL